MRPWRALIVVLFLLIPHRVSVAYQGTPLRTWEVDFSDLKAVFAALRAIIEPPKKAGRRIGFRGK